MKRIALSFVLVAGLSLTACAGQTDTQQRVLSGGAVGALGGTAIGAIAGNAGLGAVIGTAAGVAGGYIYDQNKKAQERSYQTGYAAGQQASAPAK